MSALADLLSDLHQLEKTAATSHGSLILDAFIRHTPFDDGAVYLRDGREAHLRLAAKSQHCQAPELILPDGELLLEPAPHAVLPLRSAKERHGVVAPNGEPRVGDGA